MHVLYVIGGKGIRYGAEVVASNILELLTSNHDIKFTVVTNSKGVISELCERLDIECHIVKICHYVYAKEKNPLLDALKRITLLTKATISDLRSLKKLEKVIDFSTVDIVHTNLSRNMLGARIARKYGIAHVWHIQEMFNAHYKLSFLMDNQIDYMNQNSDAFIGISKTVSNDWVSHGLLKDKMHTILNGVEKSRNNYKKKAHKGYSLVMVAQITPPKGQEFVVEALSKLTTQERSLITIDFIGGGRKECVDSLKDVVLKNGIKDRVKFWGHIDDVNSILFNYDIFINASDGEGFGLSTAEAMMNSVCPLVSDRGANMELVIDKVTGVVYKLNNTESFLASIRYLLNDKVLDKLSINAYKYAIETFDKARQMKEIYDLYNKVLKKG